MSYSSTQLVQLIAAFGIFNVWFLRFQLSTPFRGGTAKNLREEFRAYGLSDSVFRLVGTLKVACAVLLVAGLWFPQVTVPAASLLAVLMVGAIAMHLKIRDPLRKSLPALVMLLLNLWVAIQS